ncbi:MAG: glycosyltransferase family 4 protein [Gemmatimonadetes bacterium]|nr:glycosyltransferase family 4 protein [Gemmatimonadota bacterium]
MKLLFLQEVFWPAIGGIEVLSLRALVALRQRGHEPVVVTSFGDRDLPARDEVMGISVFRLPFRKALGGRSLEAVIQCRAQIARLKRELEPDVMQLNFSGPSGYFLLATATRDDAPLVMAVRHPLNELTCREGSLTYRLLRAASWVTGNSRSTLDAARSAVPEIGPRSSVILNGLPAPGQTPADLSFEPPELLCLGRLVYEKGFHVAVEAFSLIRNAFPAARLTIAGDGPARQDLEAQVRRLGIQQAVLFTGWVSPDDVPDTINRASMVLMPSREESFGLVALESGLMGRPVIASRVGGLPEVVQHGETGLTVPRDDPEAMAAAAVRLLREPDRARRFGEAARERGLATFALDRYVDQYEALYRRLAGRDVEHRKAG